MNVEELIRNFVPSSRWEDNPNNGRHAECHIIDDHCVLKTFQTQANAISAFAGQILLNKIGYAPECWGWGIYCGYYGFFSQRAIVSTEQNTPYKYVDKLSYELENHRVMATDLMCVPNTGWLDNRLVCIDTGDIRYIDENGEYVYI